MEKELILINPPVSSPLVRLSVQLFFKKSIPFSLLTLAALTPKEYKIRIFNLKLFWLRRDFPVGALVGITAVTASIYEAYRLADRYRRAGAYVIMGGPHVSALPEEALTHADSVVIGEAESVWSEVIRDHENRALKKIYRGELLDDFFSPVYDAFLNLDPGILRSSGLILSRGCKYSCDFCGRPLQKLRFVKLEQGIEIIKTMKKGAWGTLLIDFKDNNIFSSQPYAKELFKRLIPLKIKWRCTSSVDIAFDEEALELARQSGCKSLFIGFETIYPKDYRKTSLSVIASPEDYLRAVRKIKSYGIKVIGSFILGLDHYSHRDYLKLLWFLARAMFWHPSLTILTPFPGSELFERLKKEGRILTYDWRKYDLLFHVVFRPKTMTASLLGFWFLVVRTVSALFSPYVVFCVLFPVIASYHIFYALSSSIVEKLAR